MLELLARNWGLIALRGAAALLFGLLTLFMPGITLAVLILLFGAFAIADGVFTVGAALRRRRSEQRWGAYLVSGILAIGIGIVTFLWPGLTALVLLYLIAAWAIVTGIAQLVTAIRLREVLAGEWLLLISGILSVLLGVALVMFPAGGALAVALWIGASTLVLGIMWIALAFRLRRWHREGARSASPV